MNESRLQELFLEATELPPEARAGWLERLERAEPGFASRLRALLANPETDPSPIDRPAVAEPPTPERVGPYRIVREIGRGGMGRVFLAEQETPNFTRSVALKLIDRPRLDTDAVRRFRDEVRILASLEHPGIVRFYDGGKSNEGVWYLALEFVEGRDILHDAERRALDTRERAELVRAVAQAVAHAHARGIVHRDIKPGNILVGVDGRPRLLDFGISKLLDADGAAAKTATRDSQPLTPAYASPEQLRGEPATPASDVYSLGVVLYELLHGERPGAGTIAPPRSRPRGATAASRPASASARKRRIPRTLDAICRKALDVGSAARFADAGAFAEALARHLDGRGRRRAPGTRIVTAALLGVAALSTVALLLSRPRGVAERLAAPGAAAPRPLRFPFDPLTPRPIEELEPRFASSPGSLATGAELTLALAHAGRFDEAAILIGRLRQIPGLESDPLTDYVEAWIAHRRRESQKALILLDQARANAIRDERRDLIAEIRSLRGSVLSTLGQRAAAIAELELALADAQRGGDRVGAYRTLNDLAIERLQAGELAAGEALLARAIEAAQGTDLTPLVALGNLSEVHLARGRPDLARERLLALLALRKKTPSARREAQALLKLYEAERELGSGEAATAALERATALLRSLEKERDLALALYLEARRDLDAARFARIDALVSEIQAVAKSALDRRALGLAREIAGRRAALAGDFAGARRLLEEGHRILLDQGDSDLAARADIARLELELDARAAEAAEAIQTELETHLGSPEWTRDRFLATAHGVRLAALRGERERARSELSRLEAPLAASRSLGWHLGALAASSQLALAEGELEAARRDATAAAEAARRSDRTVAELEARLLAAAAAGEPVATAAAAGEVARAADRLGLGALATHARGVAADARRR